MTLETDSVKFEHRSEVEDLYEICEKYIRDNPNAENIKAAKRLLDLMEVLNMSW